jgi:hypothetical protein
MLTCITIHATKIIFTISDYIVDISDGAVWVDLMVLVGCAGIDPFTTNVHDFSNMIDTPMRNVSPDQLFLDECILLFTSSNKDISRLVTHIRDMHRHPSISRVYTYFNNFNITNCVVQLIQSHMY